MRSRNGPLYETDTLELTFGHGSESSDFQKTLNFKGFVVESMQVSQATEYAFSWVGRSHYVAIHDLVMQDGEMSIAGGKPVAGRDIRDKITYLPPSASITGWSKIPQRRNTYTAMFFDPELLSEQVEKQFSTVELAPHVYFENRNLLQPLRQLERAVTETHRQSDIYIETLALLCALELSRLQNNFNIGHLPKSGSLSRTQELLTRDFIAENFKLNPTLDQLAAIVGLSRFHFARAFKVTFGIPPHQYVTDRKLEAASAMLKMTPLNLIDIAGAVGFNSPDQLIRAFTKSFHVTPGQFRKML